MKSKMPIVYTDIDLNFNMHPVTRDLSKKTNVSAIIQSIRLLVLSNMEEILWSPEIGGNISRALFKINDSLFRLNLERTIAESIQQHEPRAQLQGVTVFTPQNQPKLVKARVTFFILNIEEAFVEDIILFRTR